MTAQSATAFDPATADRFVTKQLDQFFDSAYHDRSPSEIVGDVIWVARSLVPRRTETSDLQQIVEDMCFDLAERKGTTPEQADTFIEHVMVGVLGFCEDAGEFDAAFVV